MSTPSPMQPLAGKTLFITGASRGIGLAIALRAAQDGANIAIAAKTAQPHPKLSGTIYTAAAELEAAQRAEAARVEALVDGGIVACDRRLADLPRRLFRPALQHAQADQCLQRQGADAGLDSSRQSEPHRRDHRGGGTRFGAIRG